MSVVQNFGPNEVGRDFIVGDIHGCFDQLQSALDTTGFDYGQDRLFSVGDLIDRGPDSAAALEWLCEPWFHAVLGNHEEMMLKALLRGAEDKRMLWLINGGEWHLHTPAERLQALLARINCLPLAIEVDTGKSRVGIVHADVPPGYTWAELMAALEAGEADENSHLREFLLWSRMRHLDRATTRVEGIDAVYTGHTIVDSPICQSNVHFIDTGAFLPEGQLTLLAL